MNAKQNNYLSIFLNKNYFRQIRFNMFHVFCTIFRFSLPSPPLDNSIFEKKISGNCLTTLPLKIKSSQHSPPTCFGRYVGVWELHKSELLPSPLHLGCRTWKNLGKSSGRIRSKGLGRIPSSPSLYRLWNLELESTL